MKKFLFVFVFILILASCVKQQSDDISGYWAATYIEDPTYSMPIYIEKEEITFYNSPTQKFSAKLKKFEEKEEILYDIITNENDQIFMFFDKIIYNKKEKTYTLVLTSFGTEAKAKANLIRIGKTEFENLLSRGLENSIKANMHTIQVALETFYVDNQSYNIDTKSLLQYLPIYFVNPYIETSKSFVISSKEPKWTKDLIGTVYIQLHQNYGEFDYYVSGYSIYGFGEKGLVDLVLTNTDPIEGYEE